MLQRLSHIRTCVQPTQRFRAEVLGDLSAALAAPGDLAKVPAMLAEAQTKQATTGAALSELIALHCSQLRRGLEEMESAMADVDTVKRKLGVILELCTRSDVLSGSESRIAADVSTVQVRFQLAAFVRAFIVTHSSRGRAPSWCRLPCKPHCMWHETARSMVHHIGRYEWSLQASLPAHCNDVRVQADVGNVHALERYQSN